MATTLTQGFQRLRENLEISGLQSTTVSQRQSNVRTALENEMTVLSSSLVGSYQRSTMISPLADADVDILAVMHASYFRQDGQSSLLDKVKGALAKSYSTSDISRNGQAVTIRFTDFRVDVVPAFDRQGGGYLIPDSIQSRWISTNPIKHIEQWAQSNARNNGSLVPLMKMIKGWNVKHSCLLRSFHLEALVRQVFEIRSITDWVIAVRTFFDVSRSSFTYVSDPAGYGGNLGDYLSTYAKQTEVQSRLQAAYDKAVEAERAGSESRISDAFTKWRIIFGDYFPTYG